MNRLHFWLRSDNKYMVHWIFESKPVAHNVTQLIVIVTVCQIPHDGNALKLKDSQLKILISNLFIDAPRLG